MEAAIKKLTANDKRILVGEMRSAGAKIPVRLTDCRTCGRITASQRCVALHYCAKMQRVPEILQFPVIVERRRPLSIEPQPL